jgi:tetratricopeptide (TPR) repeat protein
MDAVTYPAPEVIDFISTCLIALRVPADNKKLMTRFNISWTPTLLVLDGHGKVHRRTVGFLPPAELLPSLQLGIAQYHFELERFAEALTCLEQMLADYPNSKAVPEAVFLKGACSYKYTHNTGLLKETYARLSTAYPQSEWTQRAEPYGLL